MIPVIKSSQLIMNATLFIKLNFAWKWGGNEELRIMAVFDFFEAHPFSGIKSKIIRKSATWNSMIAVLTRFPKLIEKLFAL